MTGLFGISAAGLFLALLPLLIPVLLLIVMTGLLILQQRNQQRLIQQNDEIIRLLVRQDRKTREDI
ncbi:hypothetical protein [Macrococcus equipercicus]|uniref:Uncharacterized protein n=1 Tax=Macrococcus equipercicus TaxID=69967 RepID=A0A9Q9BSU0_9STAP|nr:hypothetical protein [Macrococcus equipercicus]KAA1039323.1 hypothetical protein ERX35_007055 [Macrococcus equipercicus]UTH13614.1 hypothetical protein KFV11_10385 [Macrococcus equipercicus]